MPDFDGLELTRRVRSEPQNRYTYVILLTALGGKQNFLAAMEAGVDDFLTKPPDREQLLARIKVAERILGLKEEVRRLAGLLPTCMYCKKIRDEVDTWVPIEAYVTARSEADFSHSICPECEQTRVRADLERLARELGQAGDQA